MRTTIGPLCLCNREKDDTSVGVKGVNNQQCSICLQSSPCLYIKIVYPYAAGGYFVEYEMKQEKLNMTETLAYGYSSESICLQSRS